MSRPTPQRMRRWYCPECGDVATTTLRRVPPHERWTTTDGRGTAFPYAGEPLQEVYCPGGAVDPEKDRAP